HEYVRRPGSVPAFLAVADDDEFRPSIQAVEFLYSLDSNPGKRFVHYAVGGHGADMFPFHRELPGMIADWFVTTLVKTPGQAPPDKNPPAIPAEIKILDSIDQPGGADKVAAKLAEARQRDPKAKLFDENLVNFLGYEHLQASDTKGAVAIMKLNVTAFPESANVYDSLSDAYLADGQKDLARENARKALGLLASDTSLPPAARDGIKASAEQKLKQLGEKSSN
ncbi:MAG TPA: hypothetical protein VI685_27065, partial [Candidatus Angelobacter sp.]